MRAWSRNWQIARLLSTALGPWPYAWALAIAVGLGLGPRGGWAVFELALLPLASLALLLQALTGLRQISGKTMTLVPRQVSTARTWMGMLGFVALSPLWIDQNGQLGTLVGIAGLLLIPLHTLRLAVFHPPAMRWVWAGLLALVAWLAWVVGQVPGSALGLWTLHSWGFVIALMLLILILHQALWMRSMTKGPIATTEKRWLRTLHDRFKRLHHLPTLWALNGLNWRPLQSEAEVMRSLMLVTKPSQLALQQLLQTSLWISVVLVLDLWLFITQGPPFGFVLSWTLAPIMYGSLLWSQHLAGEEGHRSQPGQALLALMPRVPDAKRRSTREARLQLRTLLLTLVLHLLLALLLLGPEPTMAPVLMLLGLSLPVRWLIAAMARRGARRAGFHVLWMLNLLGLLMAAPGLRPEQNNMLLIGTLAGLGGLLLWVWQTLTGWRIAPNPD
ncbi:hypothetical protein HNQ51_000014 [Inhella inkyongensis]|uniref:Uncharacterized protein n=1 Tax=Inhella inkyongensis TaxID=392593 RepID=A0A840S217_9BURK|nr:hypothetical protein [Inhella inkyongensis]MBB5202721.1 hypothetical protein [Inhella inkyongensis]